ASVRRGVMSVACSLGGGVYLISVSMKSGLAQPVPFSSPPQNGSTHLPAILCLGSLITSTVRTHMVIRTLFMLALVVGVPSLSLISAADSESRLDNKQDEFALARKVLRGAGRIGMSIKKG